MSARVHSFYSARVEINVRLRCDTRHHGLGSLLREDEVGLVRELYAPLMSRRIGLVLQYLLLKRPDHYADHVMRR